MSSSTANGPSSADSGEHALEQPWQLYLHYPTFTQSIENYASEAYQASEAGTRRKIGSVQPTARPLIMNDREDGTQPTVQPLLCR